MLAAGIIQDKFAGEAVEGEGGEEETTGGYFYCYSTGTFTAQAKKSRFLAPEFNSRNTHVHMRIRNRRMYILHTSPAHCTYYIPPPLTVHFPMTRSMRYQPILHTI